MPSPHMKYVRKYHTKDHTKYLLQRAMAKTACVITPALTALLWAGQAFASQGPGVKPGTASSFTQMAMAILVYGTSALVVGIGLIGAARRH